MNIKKILLSALAMMLFVICALGAASHIDAWLLKYSENADPTKAYCFDKSMFSVLDEDGLCEFTVSDDTYLALYMTEEFAPEAFLFETNKGDALSKGTFAAALAASDESISLESANRAFDEAAHAYEKDADGEYAYYEFENWILIFSKGYEDGQYELFSAFTAEAYERMSEEEANEDTPSGEDAQPDEKDEEPAAEAESEKKQEDSKIHKL